VRLLYPAITVRRCFFFQKGGAGLERVDQILAGAESLLAVGTGNG